MPKPFMFGKIAISFLEGIHRKITCTFDLFSKVVEVFSHFLGGADLGGPEDKGFRRSG